MQNPRFLCGSGGFCLMKQAKATKQLLEKKQHYTREDDFRNKNAELTPAGGIPSKVKTQATHISSAKIVYPIPPIIATH